MRSVAKMIPKTGANKRVFALVILSFAIVQLTSFGCSSDPTGSGGPEIQTFSVTSQTASTRLEPTSITVIQTGESLALKSGTSTVLSNVPSTKLIVALSDGSSRIYTVDVASNLDTASAVLNLDTASAVSSQTEIDFGIATSGSTNVSSSLLFFTSGKPNICADEPDDCEIRLNGSSDVASNASSELFLYLLARKSDSNETFTTYFPELVANSDSMLWARTINLSQTNTSLASGDKFEIVTATTFRPLNRNADSKFANLLDIPNVVSISSTNNITIDRR